MVRRVLRHNTLYIFTLPTSRQWHTLAASRDQAGPLGPHRVLASPAPTLRAAASPSYVSACEFLFSCPLRAPKPMCCG